MHRLRLGFIFLFMASASVRADQFCFALAETYYEQVYCQLQAKAQTKNLPPFAQFKKNNEQVQASLLKRPAERNAIKLPVPAVSKPITIAPLKTTVETSRIVTKSTSNELNQLVQRTKPVAVGGSACELRGKQLYCGGNSFVLRGNQANQRLAKAVLSVENTMGLPAYQGGETNLYLTRAYQQYISKMCEIGLCGVTMTYGKFTYLYQDITRKGLDFSQRFETMFSFLKKDKANMGVSESAVLPQDVNGRDCNPLGDSFYVCESQGRNFIFVRQ